MAFYTVLDVILRPDPGPAAAPLLVLRGGQRSAGLPTPRPRGSRVQ